jgi:hypothetical protein
MSARVVVGRRAAVLLVVLMAFSLLLAGPVGPAVAVPVTVKTEGAAPIPGEGPWSYGAAATATVGDDGVTPGDWWSCSVTGYWFHDMAAGAGIAGRAACTVGWSQGDTNIVLLARAGNLQPGQEGTECEWKVPIGNVDVEGGFNTAFAEYAIVIPTPAQGPTMARVCGAVTQLCAVDEFKPEMKCVGWALGSPPAEPDGVVEAPEGCVYGTPYRPEVSAWRWDVEPGGTRRGWMTDLTIRIPAPAVPSTPGRFAWYLFTDYPLDHGAIATSWFPNRAGWSAPGVPADGVWSPAVFDYVTSVGSTSIDVTVSVRFGRYLYQPEPPAGEVPPTVRGVGLFYAGPTGGPNGVVVGSGGASTASGPGRFAQNDSFLKTDPGGCAFYWGDDPGPPWTLGYPPAGEAPVPGGGVEPVDPPVVYGPGDDLPGGGSYGDDNDWTCPPDMVCVPKPEAPEDEDSCGGFSLTDPTTWISGAMCAVIKAIVGLIDAIAGIARTLAGLVASLLEGLAGLLIPSSFPDFSGFSIDLPDGWEGGIPDLGDPGCGAITMPSLDFGSMLGSIPAVELVDTCDAPWPTVRAVVYYGVLAVALISAAQRGLLMVLDAVGMGIGVYDAMPDQDKGGKK